MALFPSTPLRNPMVWSYTPMSVGGRTYPYWTGRRKHPAGQHVGVIKVGGQWVVTTYRKSFRHWTAPCVHALNEAGVGGHVVGSLREVAHAAGDGIVYTYTDLGRAKARAAQWAY